MDRNLRRCICKAGATLNVEIVLVKTKITLQKPSPRVVKVYWPTLSVSSWLTTLVATSPRCVLGGFGWDQEDHWRELFRWFWKRFRECDPSHPIFNLETDYSLCLPIMTHGDEGRGLRSQAFMVESWQFVISHMGPLVCNTSGRLGLAFFMSYKIMPPSPLSSH